MDARLTYSIGYQYPDDDGERFPAIVADYADAVSEVYFSPGDMPSARTPAADASGLDAETADAILSEDIAELRRIDVRLSLLFNANCHGGAAVSQTLERRVCECVDRYKPDSATTASIFIAFCLKRHYHNMPVRTSVNMNLATPEEMEYVAEWFDAYCPSRELNYDLEGLERVKAWAYANGKELVILANSGCIRNCPAHAFHDNLVAHFAEIDPESTPFEETFMTANYDYYHGGGLPKFRNIASVRNALAAFGFTGDSVFRPNNLLSGGEKARLAMLKLTYNKGNFLVFDEPTNHLDIRTCEVLEDAIRAFPGTVLCVSHDRYFVEKIGAKVLTLDDYAVFPSSAPGSGSASTPASSSAPGQPPSPETSAPSASKEAFLKAKEDRANAKKLEKRLAFLESRIAELENTLRECDEILSDPEKSADFALVEKTYSERQTAAALLDEAETEYLSLLD